MMQLGGSQQSCIGTDAPESLPGCSRLYNFVPGVAAQFQQPSAFHHYSLQSLASHNPFLHVRQFLNEPVDGFRRGLSHLPHPHVTHVTRECAPGFYSNRSNYGNDGTVHSSSQYTPWSSEAYGCTYPSHTVGTPFIPIQPRLRSFENRQTPFHSLSGNSTHAQFQHTNTMEKKPTSQETDIVPDVFTDLKEALEANTSAEPGKRLLQFFMECDLNPLDRIRKILTELRSYFVNHFSCVTGDSNGKAGVKYFLLSTRLYYRVLESLLVKEAVRLPERNFSSLLAKESLHRVLIACSVEVVMFCYGNTKTFRGLADIVCFPWIIDVFHVEPFDLLRMIETFILSEPLLSLDLINHLHQIEASIIDTLAWEGKSALFQLISDIDLVKCLTEAEGSHLFMAHTVQNSLNEYSKTPVLDLFYRKVRQLTYCRLQLLCSNLDINADLEEKIWTLLQFVFTCMPSLVRNRCLDQILLCSIYGICKVANQELQFKLIVTCYRQLPSASPEVYRHVFIQPGEYNSVIVLYNVVFMPALKAVLLKFLPEKQAVVTLPRPLFMKAPYADRPYKATTGLNVYVSPMQTSSREGAKMTPRTKALYSFGDSIWSPCRSACLQFINDMMKKHSEKKDKDPLKKRLKFTDSSDPNKLALKQPGCQKSTVRCVDKPAEVRLSEQMTPGHPQTECLFSPGFLLQLTELVHDRDFFESMSTNQ